jgi:transposase
MLDAEERMEISVLSRHGGSIRSIARATGRSRNTVRRYLRGGGDITAKRKPGPIRITKLDPFKDYILERLGQLRRMRPRRWFCSGRSASVAIGAGRRV